VSLALGDLNGDGKLDMVVANEGVDGYWSVGALLGKGDGTFAARGDVSTDRATSVALGDLNKDGKLDLVTANDWGSRAFVLLGKGDGTFAPMTSYSTWSYTPHLALGDLNGDGQLDIVVASTGATEVLLGKGDGTFAPSLSYAACAQTLALGDFDGDGRLDIATVTYASTVSVLLGACW
jgi:hypothetical protein